MYKTILLLLILMVSAPIIKAGELIRSENGDVSGHFIPPKSLIELVMPGNLSSPFNDYIDPLSEDFEDDPRDRPEISRNFVANVPADPAHPYYHQPNLPIWKWDIWKRPPGKMIVAAVSLCGDPVYRYILQRPISALIDKIIPTKEEKKAIKKSNGKLTLEQDATKKNIILGSRIFFDIAWAFGGYLVYKSL